MGWKTTPARWRLFRPRPVSIVMLAVVIANSRSGAAPFSLPFVPRRASRKPTGLGGRALGLCLEPLESLDPLLHRRVCREKRRRGALHARRHDEEGVQALGPGRGGRGAGRAPR